MTQPRGFPSWDELYRKDAIEQLPWYFAALDPDLDTALARHAINRGRALDLGTGPGTQAIALAERGFTVTATDVSPSALAYVARKAKARGALVKCVEDDVTETKLAGPFDFIFDRGCFHVLEPNRREAYVASMHRLLAPGGMLFLKTFSHLQPGTEGPHRFTQDDIRGIFAGDRFDVIDITETVFQGQLDPLPRALFSILQAKPTTSSPRENTRSPA